MFLLDWRRSRAVLLSALLHCSAACCSVVGCLRIEVSRSVPLLTVARALVFAANLCAAMPTEPQRLQAIAQLVSWKDPGPGRVFVRACILCKPMFPTCWPSMLSCSGLQRSRFALLSDVLAHVSSR